MNDLNKYSNKFKEFRKKFIEFSQRKSDFQIDKFIALSDSNIPSHIYRHVLIQLRVALSEIRKKLIKKERLKREIERIMNRKGLDYDLDILSKNVEIEDLEYEILSKKDEIEKYDIILQKLEEKYGEFTNKQYQEDEVLYWTRRLSMQMHDSIVDRMTGVGAGNLAALREAADEPILDERNKIIDLPADLKMLDLISKAKHLYEVKEIDNLIKKAITNDGKKGDIENEIYQIQAKND